MTARRHRIARYEYSFDAAMGGARLTLWDPAGVKLAEIGFLDGAAALPQPRIAADSSYAAAFMRINALPPLIDMLRNESPVFLMLDSATPGDVLISTLDETPHG